MKLILIVILVLKSIFIKLFDPIRCIGKNYTGYIFDSTYTILKSVDMQQKRFTPSCEDIRKAEKILSGNLASINKQNFNQVDDCPIIHEKLQKYVRQYVGFVNMKSQKIIWVNCLWNKSLEERAGKDVIIVDDGCSYFWDVEVNLNTGELANLMINGSA